MTKKKAIIIISVVIVLVIAGVAIFYFYFANKENGGIAGLFPSGEDQGIFPTPDGTGEIEIPSDGSGDQTGTNTGSPIPGQGGNFPGQGGSPSQSLSTLRKLSVAPVSGATIFKNKNGDDVIRFTDRAKGYIFEVLASGGTPTRISNTLLPKIYESLWADNG